MPHSDPKIRKLIKTLRLKAGYESLEELYKVSNVTTATLSRIEAGIHTPSPRTLGKLAPHLNVEKNKLFAAAGYLDPDSEKDIAGVDSNHSDQEKQNNSILSRINNLGDVLRIISELDFLLELDNETFIKLVKTAKERYGCFPGKNDT